MAVATNVPSVTWGPLGFQAPSEADILAGVQQDINTAFGGNLNPALNSPQGQLASSQTAIIGEVNDTFLFYANQVDPSYAEGRMQDAIGRIYFLERNPALSTVVQAVCAGLVGVVIPVGAQAIAEDGNVYTCTEQGTILVGGSITLPFSCNSTGPIACPAGALNQIYQAIPGWDTVNNPADGVLGQDVESRYQFEARRQATVASNSAGSLPSIKGAVLEVPGVLGAYVTENTSASPLIMGGYTLVPNSVYVAVAGGAPAAIAEAIWSRKAPGCAYNGNTSFVVQDTSPGYSPPYPSYTVLWETPIDVPIIFSVNLVNNTQVPSNAATLIQNAIVSAFAGGDGGSIATIASLLLASRYYPPVSALGSWAQIRTLQIGSQNTPSASIAGYIQGNTLNVKQLISGSVQVGQTLVNGSVSGSVGGSVAGSGVIDGTTITALGTGVGGTGTYTLNNSLSVGATFTANGTGTSITASNVSGYIAVGDLLLNGTGVPANTFIVGQLSGTLGGAGVYQVNNICNLTNTAATANVQMFCVLANQNSVQVNIDQVPTISAANISVTVT